MGFQVSLHIGYAAQEDGGGKRQMFLCEKVSVVTVLAIAFHLVYDIRFTISTPTY